MGWTVALKKEYNSIYKAACSAKDDARLVQAKDAMMEILLQCQMAELKFMKPKKVVPHIANRGGSKIQWTKIFEKLAKIITVGVSKAACGHDRAVCFSVTEKDRSSAIAHVEVCKISPHYANFVDPDIVDGASVGCGHWNQGLANIEDEVLVPVEFREKLCEKGKDHLDKERLCKTQPVLRSLLDTGLQWFCIRPEVQIDFPQTATILQKALNVEHHIGEGQRNT